MNMKARSMPVATMDKPRIYPPSTRDILCGGSIIVVLRHRNRQPFCPKTISGHSPVNPLSSFFPRVALSSLSSSFLLLPLHPILSILLILHSTLSYTPILLIMFAARQSLNLFQKRAFSASASQVRFSSVRSSVHLPKKSYQAY